MEAATRKLKQEIRLKKRKEEEEPQHADSQAKTQEMDEQKGNEQRERGS